GAEPVLAPRRVADADRLSLREQRVDQRVGYLLVHIETRERRALLAAHAEGGAHDTARGALEIGARGDDAGILATHLGDARARNRRRLQRLHDAHADLVRAGEGRPGGERVGNQSGSDFGALAAEIVEHPGWQPRIADAVGEQAPRPRRGGGALQHDGIAGHERRGGLAAGNSPSTWAESAGFVLTKCRCAGRSRPAMKSGWRPPRRSRARSTADSKRACSSGGGSNIVA